MSEQNEYFKVLAITESHFILTNIGLYRREQWPTVVEWWLVHGDYYDDYEYYCELSKKVDDETAQRLERMFQEKK